MSVLHHRLLAPLVARIGQKNPLVMCITNRVTPQRVADLLLASGASPAMIDNPAEVPAFASISSAVYANLGLHSTQSAALEALAGMGQQRPPLVLDPVGFGASAYRNEAIEHVLDKARPEVIKGNSNEICGLAGAEATGQGVDSAADTANAMEPALALSRKHGRCVVCVSGNHDLVVRAGAVAFEDVVVRIVGDAPLMAKVTGTGCSLGAVVAAGVASVEEDALLGAVAAHAMYTAAALRALEVSRDAGPGSLAAALPDALHAVAQAPEELLALVRVEVLRGKLNVPPQLTPTPTAAATAGPTRGNGLHVVTDDAFADEGLLAKLEAAVDGGATVVQLRLKSTSTEEYVAWAWRVKELCLRRGVTFIVDDRVDVALAVDADGAHVGRGDMPPAVARRLLGPDKILGVSTYGSRTDVRRALDPDVCADYVGSPPCFPTSTKTNSPGGVAGVGHLQELRGWVEEELQLQGRAPGSCPVVAIGGVDTSNAAACVANEARGLAVVSTLLASEDLAEIKERAAALTGACTSTRTTDAQR